MRDTVSLLFVAVFIVALFVTVCSLASPHVQCWCVFAWSVSLNSLHKTFSLCAFGEAVPLTLQLIIILRESVCLCACVCQRRQLLVCIYVGLWSLFCCQFYRNAWEKSVCAFIHTVMQRRFVDHTLKKLDRLLESFLICRFTRVTPACMPACLSTTL